MLSCLGWNTPNKTVHPKAITMPTFIAHPYAKGSQDTMRTLPQFLIDRQRDTVLVSKNNRRLGTVRGCIDHGCQRSPSASWERENIGEEPHNNTLHQMGVIILEMTGEPAFGLRECE
jgi:hypothetical protein